MQNLIGKDENSWVNQAWTWIHSNVRSGSRVFLPAGGTPTPLYKRFCQNPSDPLLRSLHFMQIDEIVDGPKQGYFRQYFEREMAPFLEQMEWIGEADEVADVAILGVGVNGHVAFHEPGLPRGFGSGCVRLSAETLRYLELPEPTWGLTYGVSAFERARKILVLAQGQAKQSVLRRALSGESLPISWILEHPQVTVVSDFEL